MIEKKILDMLEELGWSVEENDDEIDIESWSPAGENLIETLEYDGTNESLLKSLRDMYNSFDVDEHVKMWAENMNSVAGVPQSIRELLEDAEAIEDMYFVLSEEIDKLCQ